jgi:hypothetical protein
VPTFGIHSREQFLRMGDERRFLGARVAYNLLRVGENPSSEEIKLFEDLCITLRTSNGTFRTTFRDRFRDVDAESVRWIKELFPSETPIRVQDRAVSTGLTSAEWAKRLFQEFANVDFEASDLLTELLELPVGDETYILEPSGKPLQYIRPPFVISIDYRESWRNPILRWMSARVRRKFAGLSWDRSQVRPISFIHPEARALERANPNFRFVVRSIFDRTPGAADVLRTMNILNLSYFSREELSEARSVIFDSVAVGGLWIAGRTLEEDFTNHVTFFRRREHGWDVVGRIGRGSEIEDFA